MNVLLFLKFRIKLFMLCLLKVVYLLLLVRYLLFIIVGWIFVIDIGFYLVMDLGLVWLWCDCGELMVEDVVEGVEVVDSVEELSFMLLLFLYMFGDVWLWLLCWFIMYGVEEFVYMDCLKLMVEGG